MAGEAGELLREETEAVLASLRGTGRLYDLTREALTRRKRGLAHDRTNRRGWSLLPMAVCEAISGHFECALPAAAAMQFFMAAADVFDDIEDADSVDSLSARYGPGVATNVATTLLILAEKSVAWLETRGVPEQNIVRVMDAVNSFYTTACNGQHLDLSLLPSEAVSEDEYLKITYMKSATTVECACYIGALLATRNQELIDVFARFGHNLGMASQIANDIRGVTDGSDITRHKITLPVIFALANADKNSDAFSHLEETFVKRGISVVDSAPVRDLLYHTGAIHYATVQMELFMQNALDALAEAEKAGVKVDQLKQFLE